MKPGDKIRDTWGEGTFVRYNALGYVVHFEGDGFYQFRDGAAVRAELIAKGLLRPRNGLPGVTPIGPLPHIAEPVLRIDDLGLASAARDIRRTREEEELHEYVHNFVC